MKKLFDEIDNYFYSKNEKDRLMIYLLIVGVIAFVIFYLIMPSAQEYRQNQMDRFSKTKNQYQALKNKKMALNTQKISMQKKIKNLILQKDALKKRKDFYDELANLLDFVQFNSYKWGEFVKELVANAKKEGLKVLGFTNKVYNEQKKMINKKMEITLDAKGEYKNFIYFIYQYENIRELLRIENINIKSDKTYKVKFTLYGYEK
jgi:Tfp pilus assembly protein PilO